ncbi:zeatin O-glucosyltransferase-like [Nicotiana tabacum]|uniref:Glycosyltransferase n=1 Tax=Nicotiana tabacum TaxID=4097 RepID=A0A1S4CQP2_TOBAC|nr:PREDICTED: zeatin O-glucosyltransferase-like [Nicotiana tabacum]WIW42696.1 UDP-glycosyltransferase [Nicotiana tabacum]
MASLVIPSSGNHGQIGMEEDQITMVMVPFPAQGHFNQFLHLSRLVSSYHIPIHYVGFSTEISQVKARMHGWDLATATNYIHFQEFPTPSSYMAPGPCNFSNNSSETISKLIASVLDASLTLREPVSAFIKKLSSTTRRVVVIYDSMMASTVQDVVSIKNAEAYCFHAISAFANSSLLWDIIKYYLHLPSFLAKLAKKLFLPSGAYIPDGLPTLRSIFTPEFIEFMRLQHSCNKFSSGNLYDTCKVLEGPYLETLAKFSRLLGIRKQWAVGPFNPVTISGEKDSKVRHKCLEWLDKQAQNSVILVSFGTTGYLSMEQIKELAIGLEKSQQKFIWVVRDVLSGGEEEVRIPEGYEERVKERGIIVKDWAPQLEILAHSSTGGFMSHCGWNSCMESITMGVPIATWPMNFDQPRNAVFVTDVLKIGVVVKNWDRRDDMIDSITIKNAVEKLMASTEGHEMRMRAMELGKQVKETVKDGGDHQKEMDSFIAHVTRY